MDLNFDWAEAIGLLFIVLGFAVGLFAVHPYVLVAVVFLAGLMFGRAWFGWKKRGKVPLFLIVMCFLLGALVWFFYVDPRVLLIAFCAGAYGGFKVFEKKLIRAVR